MWEGVVDATGRGWGFHYNVLGIAPDFRADNGFVPRTGFVKPNIAHRFTWYGRPGALAERFQIFATTNGLWRYDDFFDLNSLLEDQASVQGTLTLRGGWSLNVSPTGGDGDRLGLASSRKSFLLMSSDGGGTWIFRDGERWLWRSERIVHH